ncbi:MAG: flagellar filament capping protein FliD [Planctomycetota bacterium]
MGRLQSSIGLITGTDIVGTVDQLIAISAQPRDRLLARTSEIEGQQQELASLTASVIGVQLAGNALGTDALFTSKSATSSNDSALSAATGDNAVAGQYTVLTLQTAATHSVQSIQSFAARDTALGLAGSITVKPDGFVDQAVSLSDLNDGLGVEAGSIRLTDRSGATADVDLSTSRTIDDVLQAINDADVEIRATTRDGKIRLIDESGATSSNLKLEQLGIAETAADLGLWGIDVASSVADGNAINLPTGVTSLRGPALSQLNGGNGLGALTTLDLQLSDGSTAGVDLSGTGSLSEIIDEINASGLDLIARINDAGNGLRIRDVSGGSGSFTITSADNTASSLGFSGAIDGDIAVGADLNLQTVTTETALADLNQGTGPTTGSFTIQDSNGDTAAVNLTVDEIDTVGELIDRINALDVNVTAGINDAGDGIKFTDNAGGTSLLSITDSGTGTVAADLGISGTVASGVTSVSGSQSTSISIDADDTLDDIVTKINAEGRYGTASVVAGDNGTFQLQIRANQGGDVGRLAISSSADLDLNLRTISRGQDAVITISSDGGNERFLTSTDGVFEDSITGLNLTAKAITTEPVSITVEDNPDAVVGAINTFVDQYNLLVDRINETTFFNAETSEVGLLFGSSETLRIQSGYSRLLSGRTSSTGSVRSLAQIGVRLDENGKLQVDTTKLRDSLASDSAGVAKFFNNVDSETEVNNGFVGQLDRLADRLAGDENSVLLGRTQTLATQVERNNERVETLNLRLDAERERLLAQFYSTEEAIAKIQSNQAAIDSISFISLNSNDS